MRGATMGATKDYSQYKVAKSMQEGEGQFFGAIAATAEDIVMANRPRCIR